MNTSSKPSIIPQSGDAGVSSLSAMTALGRSLLLKQLAKLSDGEVIVRDSGKQLKFGARTERAPCLQPSP